MIKVLDDTQTRRKDFMISQCFSNTGYLLKIQITGLLGRSWKLNFCWFFWTIHIPTNLEKYRTLNIHGDNGSNRLKHFNGDEF